MTNKSIRDYINLIENAQREGVAEGFNELDDGTNVVAIQKLSDSELMRHYQDFKKSASMTNDKQHHYALQHLANEIKRRKQGVAEAGKNPHPKTWHDVDKKLGKAVDKMSQAEKVKKGYAHPDTLKKKGVAEGSEEQVYKVVALDKSNALKKPTKLNVKASSIEDVFSRLAANDWYALSINGVEVVAGKRLKQGVAEEQLEETSPEAIAKIEQLTRN